MGAIAFIRGAFMSASLLQWSLMGGYGIYIWSAYGLVLSVLVINLLSIRWQRKQVRRLIKRWMKHETRT